MTMKTIFNFIVAAMLGMSVLWLTGCPTTSSDPDPEVGPRGFGETPTTDIAPYDPVINGSALYCNGSLQQVSAGFTLTPPAAPDPDDPDSDATGIPRWNISKTPEEPNIGNNVKRLAIAVEPAMSDGSLYSSLPEDDPNAWTSRDDLVHPMVVSYAGQVIGNYSLGEGSADIGDPDNIDDIFVALSLDNGKTWKDLKVSESAWISEASETIRSSIKVSWDTDHDGTRETIDYPAHSHKPTMTVQKIVADADNDGVNEEHHYILVAWLDKYCPSGDPFSLDDAEDVVYQDYFKVKGNQGSIDYDLPCDNPLADPDSLDYDCAPNGQAVYEVPFSCVWTARGEFLQETDDEGNPVLNEDGDPLYGIEWRKAQQLTSGTRDANKIWLAPSEAGFAMAWQEDPEGLRSGKGAGPGVGWSGATTNHGADIWFTKINAADFGAVVTIEDDPDVNVDGKPQPLNNFDYPVRITDNEKCNGDGDTKLYCAHICDGAESTDCVTEYVDMLSYSTLEEGEYYSVLDGDTGASRPAMQILKTDMEELVVVLGYEETKGLAETEPGVPDQGDVDPDDTIEDEGKSVYFESFVFPTEPVMDLPLDGDDTVPTFRVPVVSAGYIVNQLVPEVTVTENDDGTSTVAETGEMIYENARRLVIMTHVDNCEADAEGAENTFGFMYKQGIYTRGGPSDMYIRLNSGFTYTDVNDEPLFADALNVSSHEVVLDDDGKYTDAVTWDVSYMTEHQSYTILEDNTFSPRGWLRGIDVFTAFEYTPNWDESSHGSVPNKFHFNATTDGTWVNGPIIISKVSGSQTSTLDPRIKVAPKGKLTEGIVSDLGNPDAIFMVYGTYDMDTGEEEDLFYTWSTDRGVTWDVLVDEDGLERNRKLAARSEIQEKEAQIIASPDGSMLWTVWNQESHEEPAESDPPEHFLGLDSWVGRVDYEVTDEVQ